MTMHGKWSVAGVPHKGWACLGVDDLEDDRELCEMCETVEIRYVHTMQHPDYPATLRCGCVCAGNMEQDLVAARRREREAQNRTTARMAWGARGWVLVREGYQTHREAGFLFVVYRTAVGTWSGSIERIGTRKCVALRPAATPQAIKAAMFDALAQLKR